VAEKSGKSEYRQHRYRVPPGATEILLVRHGESAPADPDEPFPLVDGHGDPPLDPVGVEQAERLAHRLVGEQIDAIYLSTLCRTAQTAAPLAERLGIEPRVEADLREVFLGEWEGGMFRAKASGGDPAFQRAMKEERWDYIPGAENQEAFAARTSGAIARIHAAHPDQRVVAVAHGGVIGMILSSATRSRPFAFIGPDNASISHIVVAGAEIVLRRFNDTAHLHPHFTVAAPPPT
jgi:2,3-bisphosphoglycerate-dependent phosphoglycerate mutase